MFYHGTNECDKLYYEVHCEDLYVKAAKRRIHQLCYSSIWYFRTAIFFISMEKIEAIGSLSTNGIK